MQFKKIAGLQLMIHLIFHLTCMLIMDISGGYRKFMNINVVTYRKLSSFTL